MTGLGEMLPNGDRLTGVMCPHRFCPGRIVYNGNYFCEFIHSGGCNFVLQDDEYEPRFNRRLKRWESVLVYPAPPLHKRMWELIRIDVWGSVEAYDEWLETREPIKLDN